MHPQHTLFDGNFKMAEAPYEYDNIKMWEANRVRKSQAPEAEKETSSNACRSIRFLPVPLFFFCFLIIFSGGMKPVCTPHPLDVLLKDCPPSSYSSFCPHPKMYVYVFFKWILTPLICLLLLFCWIDFPVEDMRGIWSICLSDCFQSAQFKRCQRHADQWSILSNLSVSFYFSFSFLVSDHLRGYSFVFAWARLPSKRILNLLRRHLTVGGRLRNYTDSSCFMLSDLKA